MLNGKLFKYWTYQLFSPGKVLKEKYAAFKSLLAHDKSAHELMAELEDVYYRQQKRDFKAVEKLCDQLIQQVAGIVDAMSRVSPADYSDLQIFFTKIAAYVRFMTTPKTPASAPPYTVDLEEVGIDDLLLVGGKALNLGVVKNSLALPTPDGFVITTNAYNRFLEFNGLRQGIDQRLAAVDIGNTAALDATAADIRKMIMAAEIPTQLKASMETSHRALISTVSGGTTVAMRSSAVGEDSRASFAGQYLTLLNVPGRDLYDAYKRIIAGKYAAEALHYRISYGLSDEETAMAVLVLTMVPAASSGVMYTADVSNPDAQNLKIHAILGLGDLLVSGRTPADLLTVAKEPPHRVVACQPALKEQRVTSSANGGLQSIPIAPDESSALAVEPPTAIRLARWGLALETHFKEPQDVEWATDSRGNVFILQTRPLKTGAQPVDDLSCDFEDVAQEVLLKGGERAAGGIAAGSVFNLKTTRDLHTIPDGAVLVARHALPEYAKVIGRIGAIVTDAGSSAGHLSSVAREFGVPALVNTRHATTALMHGRTVTVHPEGLTVFAGTVQDMVASPCAKVNPMIDSPFMRKVRYLMKFVSTLELVDPEHPDFRPWRCRSFHDIIRFCHEKAVREMFHISDNRLRKLGFAKKLNTRIPMQFYLLDVGGGLESTAASRKEVDIQDVHNQAMRALFKGLTHPDIQWGAHQHFDWEAHDRIVMSGGIASPKATMFASHAVISDDYMNLNLRFGYHFVIVDALCGQPAEDNILQFRFSGGGTEMSQRMLRADFLKKCLERLDFEVSVKSDLVDGQLKGADRQTSLEKLDMVGRLLGATPLMDLVLKDAAMVEGFVDAFMQGKYQFGAVDTNR